MLLFTIWALNRNLKLNHCVTHRQMVRGNKVYFMRDLVVIRTLVLIAVLDPAFLFYVLVFHTIYPLQNSL